MSTVSSKGTALVTGASSGIGAIYAQRLAERGYDVILVARNRDRLNALATRLTNETGRSFEVVEADLGSKEGVRHVENILRTDSSITLLVNNAGVGATAPLVDSDIDKMDDMITLNVIALTHLTKAVVPGFLARGAGTIINIASIVAVGPEILNGVYGGSKAYVLALSQSLHHEVGAKGIRVQVVLPGATSTEFWEIAGTPEEYLPKEIVMNAEDMVDAALAGLDQGELVTIPSLPEAADWNAYEAARQKLMPNLSRNAPAERFGVKSRANK
ncbi:SDR family NAD(P)-dependent oxidoreductase [Pseudomonas sp. NA-150]|uniref:SDR family NAD(P)-dependent oxidoreductase n=1 Tax=Pseudomonas sp. NA-150 TaxID=3367525 RepID=UPI0037CBA5C8